MTAPRRSGLPTLALTPLVLAACATGSDEASGGPVGTLTELWQAGTPAFGIYVPDERDRGERAPDGSRLPALYTSEGAAELARNPLYDFLFLNLESAFDSAAVAAVAEGLATPDAVGETTLLVRIPPIEADGPDIARARVRASLASGAHGVVLPHVRGADEARLAVSFFEGLGADVWSPTNPTGDVLAMLMIEDTTSLAEVQQIADLPGYSILACGIGSLSRALGSRAEGEAGTQEVLAHARRVGLPDMITANADDVAERIGQGFLALLMPGAQADEAIRVGRTAAGR